jgi:uncharacterized protein (DUF4415 family)
LFACPCIFLEFRRILAKNLKTSPEEVKQIKKVINDDAENPEWTAEDFRRSHPAAGVLPEIVEEYRKGRGPQKRPKKVQTTLRLSPEVLEYFKMQGLGWQRKIDEALMEWEREHGKAA